MNRFVGLHLDFIGFIGSTLCAIHCALVPILIAMGLFNSTFFAEYHYLEHLFVIGAAVIAAISLIKSYLRSHRVIWPLVISATGFAMIFVLHQGDCSGIGAVFMVIGGSMVAIAHFYNWYLVRADKRQDIAHV